jgi:hypothetical protein
MSAHFDEFAKGRGFVAAWVGPEELRLVSVVVSVRLCESLRENHVSYVTRISDACHCISVATLSKESQGVPE